MIPTNIADQLRRDEGVRNFPYIDTKGNITIGIGRNLTGKGMSDAEIEIFFDNDLTEAQDVLRKRLPWFQTLDPIRQGALINMCFNLQFKKLEGFPRLLMAAAQGNWPMAAAEMLNSEWAREVGDRAARLAQQVKSGEWV